MRITEVSAYPVQAGSRNFVLVVVGTDEGVWGVGEAGLTGRELAVCGALDYLRPLLLGADLLPLDGPGLGVEFDRAAARHPPRWTEPPHLSRADGSYTNW